MFLPICGDMIYPEQNLHSQFCVRVDSPLHRMFSFTEK